MVARRDHWMSLEDFLAIDRESLDQKYEYHHGHMHALAGGSNRHSIIAGNAMFIVRQLLDEKGCHSCAVFNSDITVRLQDSCRLPDVSVSCDPKDIEEYRHYIEHPFLIIEILSPATEKEDRESKRFEYMECPSIQEYVMISQDIQRVEVFTRKGTMWLYHFHKKGDIVELKSIGRSFPIDRLYRLVISSDME
jgi:Uma2 family endonuclease